MIRKLRLLAPLAILGMLVNGAATTVSLGGSDCTLADERLAAMGMPFDRTAAITSQLVIPEAQAADVARGRFDGSEVLDSALGMLPDGAAGLAARPIWAFAMSGVPAIGSHGPPDSGVTALTVSCTVLAVDATTGQFLFGVQDGTFEAE